MPNIGFPNTNYEFSKRNNCIKGIKASPNPESLKFGWRAGN
jgi:hypothetical protein